MASGPKDTVIYHNPKCSTSRKTLDLLRDHGFEPGIVEYLKMPPSRDESPASGKCPQVRMIRDEHPILIERPFVVTPKGTRLARPIDAVREIL